MFTNKRAFCMFDYRDTGNRGSPSWLEFREKDPFSGTGRGVGRFLWIL